MKTCGIYAIVCTVNGRRYIGSSRDIRRRWNKHQSVLRTGKKQNKYLQQDWNKYGAGVFRLDVLEQVGANELMAREMYQIELFGDKCYNMVRPTPNHEKWMIAEETRYKFGDGRTEETRQKQQKASSGRKASKETRRKMSDARKGKTPALGHKWKLSSETRRKMSEAAKKREAEKKRNSGATL